MKYTINAIKTRYKGISFRSRLEAKWAAFFDLCEWRWEYEPVDFRFENTGWIPDFFVEFPCGHSECNGSHTIYAEVKPYRTIKEFEGHPAYNIEHGKILYSKVSPSGELPNYLDDEPYDTFSLGVDAVALLGLSPSSGTSQIRSLSHGDGGGDFDICFFVGTGTQGEVDMLWAEACNGTQWEPYERH